jgi:hypothetical protein
MKKFYEDTLEALIDASIGWNQTGHQVLKAKIRDLIAETDEKWAREQRKDCLISQKWRLQDEVDMKEVAADLALRRNCMVMVRYRLEQIQEMKKAVEKLESEIRFLAMDPTRVREDQITDEMIQRAKEVDFRQLHEFDARGWGLCPFHPDRSPSFHIHTASNRAKCWSGVCNWQGDTIAFVMEREGLKFHEAVRRLQ